MSNQELRPMRAHPSRDALSIFRPLRQKLDWGTGLFKVYSSSHTLKDTEFEEYMEKVGDEIALDPNELLLVHGGLYILPSPNPGGPIVWMGLSRLPMGNDIYSPSGLPFMKI
ncbi:hypothetical protein BO71DRAFT_102835 [Aspergillus ellipticus CBS 707.79]|uniref:Uncharacterized protein n=1 Tax=Aspergillus ellipticus CBS 707.79 TaxID=1448320 RepID=A0A319DUP5_9EURO|nr:hypothetical protein BO71DRAFT_102835 [Aspergillus ellipticus CBS 707.79]